MIYKHWKKVLLSLTAFLWASCDDTSSASNEPVSSSSIEAPTSDASTEGTPSSSASEDPVASSAEESATSSSSVVAESSAGEEAESSTSEQNVASSGSESSAASSSDTPNIGSSGSVARSSSSEMIAPKYGVMFTCERKGEKIVCEDGVTCTEVVSETAQSPECTGDQVCAKYGVVTIKETTYKCDDGKVYNYAEFQSKYNILDGAVDLYGCPSDICGPDSLEVDMPLYGVQNTVTRPY